MSKSGRLYFITWGFRVTSSSGIGSWGNHLPFQSFSPDSVMGAGVVELLVLIPGTPGNHAPVQPKNLIEQRLDVYDGLEAIDQT